jgi:DUF438 domain-containing protein
MSELINNSQKRKELLKHMILQLHQGEAPDLVRRRLAELLSQIPYDEVVEVEQELILEGLPEEEVLEFCDLHTMVLEGHIDQSGALPIPPGHPVDTFKKENEALRNAVNHLDRLITGLSSLSGGEVQYAFLDLHARLNELMDVDKHYLRKEYLLFPFLERYDITGPPKVMWGKHDETRQKIKDAIAAVSVPGDISVEDAVIVGDMVLRPAIQAVADMIMKEEEILLPMSMDKLSERDWYEILQQTPEFGYCLVDPQDTWRPLGVEENSPEAELRNVLRLSTGGFRLEELEALFRTLPVDITFVDKDDKVRFFSLGPERIFTRNRAILGRDVRMCHPPSSVHIVEQILEDFKSGKEQSAAFWIQMKGRFIYISYLALRGSEGEYLGTVEFTQDLTHLRALQGEQRLLSYETKP